MNCFFWHKWTAWGPSYEVGDKVYQIRMCRRCDRTEHRRVIDSKDFFAEIERTRNGKVPSNG